MEYSALRRVNPRGVANPKSLPHTCQPIAAIRSTSPDFPRICSSSLLLPSCSPIPSFFFAGKPFEHTQMLSYLKRSSTDVSTGSTARQTVADQVQALNTRLTKTFSIDSTSTSSTRTAVESSDGTRGKFLSPGGSLSHNSPHSLSITLCRARPGSAVAYLSPHCRLLAPFSFLSTAAVLTSRFSFAFRLVCARGAFRL
jgi:hypothetical protein